MEACYMFLLVCNNVYVSVREEEAKITTRGTRKTKTSAGKRIREENFLTQPLLRLCKLKLLK